jgi:hypothetical protein
VPSSRPQVSGPASELPEAPGTTAKQHSETEALTKLRSSKDRVPAGISESINSELDIFSDLPEFVAIPMGTRISLVLQTPLDSSTAYEGQPITFRTTGGFNLEQGLQLPPEVQLIGHVAEVKRPSVFGKAGTLRLMVDRIAIPGVPPVRLRGQLRAAGNSGGETLVAQGRRSLTPTGLAVVSAQGALAGSQFGGKAASIGAGAGVALAAVLVMSQRGKDVIAPVGTHFSFRVLQDANLAASAVLQAQQDYAERHRDDIQADDGFHPTLKRRTLPAK